MSAVYVCLIFCLAQAVTTMLVLYFAAVASASIGILLAKVINPPGTWYILFHVCLICLPYMASASIGILLAKVINPPGSWYAPKKKWY